ncbi:hypothetical protein LZC95_07830 [Pendulispora brunnea]|uniref:Uncharacterized protein n=1 Tax=Pendulispora brunnea TaxID=2905690 RepID=A0ABZ2KII2_9BACT
MAIAPIEISMSMIEKTEHMAVREIPLAYNMFQVCASPWTTVEGRVWTCLIGAGRDGRLLAVFQLTDYQGRFLSRVYGAAPSVVETAIADFYSAKFKCNVDT